MAKSKSTKSEQKVMFEKITDWKSIQFVMNNLNDDQYAVLDTLEFDGERYSEFIETLINNGFDIKFGRDTYSDSYQVTATCIYQGFANSGIAVSARSTDVFDAMFVLWFKIDYIAEYNLKQYLNKTETRRKRG